MKNIPIAATDEVTINIIMKIMMGGFLDETVVVVVEFVKGHASRGLPHRSLLPG